MAGWRTLDISAMLASMRRFSAAPVSFARSPVGRSVALYAVAFGFAGLTPFLLLPVLTGHLAPADFGRATSWIVVAGIMANVGGLSTHGLLSVRYFKAERSELAALCAAALAIVAALHVGAAAWLATGPDFVADFTSLPRAYSLAALAASAAISVNLIGLAIIQASGRPGLYLILRIIQSAVEIGGCLALLRFWPTSADARILSYGVALAASALAGLLFLARQGLLNTSPDAAALRSAVRFGVPMVPHLVAGQMVSNLDRLMVAYLLGPKSLGIFMVASQLGMALSLVVEPLNRALAPWLFGQLAQEEGVDRRRIVNGTYALFALLVVIALVCATLFAAFFDLLFPAEYAAAKMIIAPVAIGMAFQGMYYGVVNYVFYAEATARLSLVTSTTVLLGGVSSYLLVSRFGIVGAGVSFLIINAALFLAVWWLARRSVPMPWFAFAKRAA